MLVIRALLELIPVLRDHLAELKKIIPDNKSIIENVESCLAKLVDIVDMFHYLTTLAKNYGYLQHANSLSDSLTAINEPVSSIDLVTVVLRGLDPDYTMIITVILNFPPLPKFKDLHARILLYESQFTYA
ncbi:hypothetical protein Ddye_006557 [Dipteronia dyeriana]|uniref:Uncharacterized protein n=1 Tax=Dipteronia dyeriana TaxID=168575 RepID=A0AAE0CQT2_9ROSI|nr:hypothetical protein Ddye_006557 [Dipteronia dyeriana]